MLNTVIARPAAQPRFPIDEEHLVIQRVLLQLGRPKNLIRTIAKKVRNHRYRVNIYCAEEAHRPLSTVSITDSFFVTVSGEDIVSNPTISRRYT